MNRRGNYSSRSMLCNSLVNFDACVLVSLCKGGSSRVATLSYV